MKSVDFQNYWSKVLLELTIRGFKFSIRGLGLTEMHILIFTQKYALSILALCKIAIKKFHIKFHFSTRLTRLNNVQGHAQIFDTKFEDLVPTLKSVLVSSPVGMCVC